MRENQTFRRSLLLSVGLFTVLSAPAFAQTASSGSLVIEDIIVTARKRDETSLTVPVVVAAVSSAQLNRLAISDMDGIARLVPQLIIAPQGGSVQGGNIAMRGISGPDSNPFGDQAVSFNIDGVQVAKATVRRMSDTDLAQVEVLKGPQALFFGKNSPGGIISIRTADPGDHFEAKATVGYEFEAREIRAEGYVSGPLSDAIGLRLAGYGSDMRGFLKNEIPADAYLAPTSRPRTPDSRDYALRGTAKFDAGGKFNARFKLNFAHLDTSGPAGTTQYMSCPYGAPQTGSIDNCRADNKTMNPGSGPVVGTLDPKFRDGFNYLEQDQLLSSLELNYEVLDNVHLTSVTGIYYLKLIQAQNYENDYSVALPSTNNLKNREFSQELRVQTAYDGPLNFVAGVYLSDTNASTGSHTYLVAAEASGLPVLAANGLDFVPLRTPFQINHYFLRQKGQAYSAFLQMSYEPVDKVEVTAGGRYSYEKKRLPLVQDGGFGLNPFAGNPLTDADIIHPIVAKNHWSDFSPEITLSYRPLDTLTLFASYKHGFLSGGFNSGSTDFTKDLSYDPQTIKGFEGGVKTQLFNNTLRLNLAAYTYNVRDLQVQAYRNATNSIFNAGEVSVKGAEFDFNYLAPLPGLSLYGGLSYNNGKYTRFHNAQCYNGQTVAMGCVFSPDIGALAQDLSGTALPRAPKWSANGGLAYERAIGSALNLGLSTNALYSSSFLTDVTSAPNGRMPKYALLDASVRVGDIDDTWEVAFIGRNLTNKFYWVASTDVPFTGGAAGTGILGDRYASVSRGRELMLRLSYKFGG